MLLVLDGLLLAAARAPQADVLTPVAAPLPPCVVQGVYAWKGLIPGIGGEQKS